MSALLFASDLFWLSRASSRSKSRAEEAGVSTEGLIPAAVFADFLPEDALSMVSRAALPLVDLLTAVSRAVLPPADLLTAVSRAVLPPVDLLVTVPRAVLSPDDLLTVVPRAVLSPDDLLTAVPRAVLSPDDLLTAVSRTVLPLSVLLLPELLPELSLPVGFVLLFLFSGILPPRTDTPCPFSTVTFLKDVMDSASLIPSSVLFHVCVPGCSGLHFPNDPASLSSIFSSSPE